MKLHSLRLGAPAVREPFRGFDYHPRHRRLGFELRKPDVLDTPVGRQVTCNFGGFIHRDSGQLDDHFVLAVLPAPGGLELVGIAGGEHHRSVFGNRNA